MVEGFRMPTKIIIAGGRDFNDYQLLCKTMDALIVNLEEVEVVCGGAKGADSLGERWAKERGLSIKYFIPDWSPNGVYDKSAGHKRNRAMGDYADCLVALWDGASKGTKGMIDYATKLGLKVRVIRYE